MNLALIIPSLGMGGAERVMAWLANGLAGRGHAVTVFTLDDGRTPPFYALDPAVRHRPLGLASVSAGFFEAAWANARRVRGLRHAILEARPGVVLSFMNTTNVLTLLAVGHRLPVVVSERVHPAHYDIGAIWNALRRWSYPRARGVICQTADVPAFFAPRVAAHCRVLPNPVRRPEDDAPPETLASGIQPLVLAMGRLDPQKGFDLLLEAFARLAPHFPDWRLTVLGEGPQRAKLELLSSSLGLARRVCFPGRVTAPGGLLRRADIFVLPSRFEGFPNALCEAMACGLPAVAFDCPSGPGEIIRHEVDGLLVPAGDVDALARSLERLMSDEILRHSLAARAPDILQRFGEQQVLDSWEQLLAEHSGGAS